MRVIITGGSGMLGTLLSRSLVKDGYEVVILSRNPGNQKLPQGVTAARWDARTAEGWGHLADGAFAILNLAGESLSGSSLIPTRWTDKRKRRIEESRQHAGEAVVAAVKAAANKPQVIYQMSGVDYYPAGDKMMQDDDPPGDTFLAHVVTDYWESSTAAVEETGVRRIIGRMAVILNLETGPLPLSAIQFRLFAGGRLGNGKQWFPWVHHEDAVRAIRFLLENEAARGPYNIVAPDAVTNEQYTKALGRVLHRPSLIPVPAFALKTALGEVASLVLDGRPVSPQKLLDLGFEFRFPKLEPALRDLLK